MDTKYHYPPEVLQLLVDTIPRLCRSKRDVLLFFRGAGVWESVLSDLRDKVNNDPDSISKFYIARTVLTHLNESGDKSLRELREVVRRVVQFEDFSTCWPEDRLEAEGLVARIRIVVNVKDSFTRMSQAREEEVRKYRESQRIETKALKQKQERLKKVRQELLRLFVMENAQERGRLLEEVLNGLFRETGILVLEGFRRIGETGQGTVEQIDGVIELDGEIYLVEMKWLKEPVGVGDVSQHLVRLFNRSESRGIVISYSGYTEPAMAICKESLSQAVIVLCKLEEFVLLLENEADLKEFLRVKIRGSMIKKQPYTRVLQYS